MTAEEERDLEGRVRVLEMVADLLFVEAVTKAQHRTMAVDGKGGMGHRGPHGRAVVIDAVKRVGYLRRSNSGVLMRAALVWCALTLPTSAVFAQAASQPAASSPPHAQAKQEQAVPKFETIRDVANKQGDKHDPHADIHAKAEEKMAEYTGKLSFDTDRLANFTLWLFFATAFMAVVALGQLLMFNRQLTVMKSTLHFADRPWLFPNVSGEINPEYLRMFRDDAQPQRPVLIKAEVHIENVGKSPAVIESFQLSLIVDVAPVPTYLPILPGQRLSLPETKDVFEMTADNRPEFMARPPAITGVVRYRTPHNELKELGFSFVLRQAAGNEWVRTGGREKNYERDV